MPNKWQIGVLVTIAFGAFFVAIILGHSPSTPFELLRLISAAITATTISVTVFHLGVWRWLPDFLAPKPDLNGTWRVKGVPWADSSEEAESFEGFMFVKQHYFTMSMRLETAESTSELEAEQFTISKGGLYQLWAVYHCEPRSSEIPNSVIPHYGAFKLTRHKADGGEILNGRYWVDGYVKDKKGRRIVGGKLELYDRRLKNYKNYDTAVRAYQS